MFWGKMKILLGEIVLQVQVFMYTEQIEPNYMYPF